MTALTAPAAKILALVDLTSLNDSDTHKSIYDLIDSIVPSLGLPAAICVYPQFVKLAKQYLLEKGLQAVSVATVTNFPSGSMPLTEVLKQTEQAISDGADEIDLVMPYQHIQAGDPDTPWQYVFSSKRECAGKAKLKVIIESGVLAEQELIAKATEVAILAGADFVKTSTGKVPVNATLAATEVMLNTIKQLNSNCGFKAAGGVKTVTQALQYLQLTEHIMGSEWINASHFRFGASGLLKDIYEQRTEN
ncbi:deoxyribose-phosphate aldolase [Pseudoalteromonas sp. T1lg65]|uniref:deoxyribose-phosphate aldolase n=1 Tax=Pseudoalteromonas sp. T1lg65 TaxID=2077101 RepID=UPI003F7B0A3B